MVEMPRCGRVETVRDSSLDQLHVEAQGLQLADEDVEGLGKTRLRRDLALHDRLVGLRAALDVVRLDRQKLLQGVGGAVGLESPDLHLAEALAAELGLAAQGLLRDQRVGSDRPRVNLVVDQVRELQHVDVADRDLLLEGLPGHPVVEHRLAGVGKVRVLEELLDLPFVRSVENRRRDRHAEDLGGPAEVGLQDLPDVHARRHAQRVEDDLDRRAVRQVRHVRLGEDARDDALVAVASGHLVADRQLALHGDVDLYHLDDTRRQLVALLQELDPLRVDAVEHLDLGILAAEDDRDLVGDLLVLQLQPLELLRRQAGDALEREFGALLDDLAAVAVGDLFGRHPVDEEVPDLLVGLFADDPDLVFRVLLDLRDLVLLDGEGPEVLVDALAGEDLDVDDRALDARRALERSVPDVAGLFAEDRPQELLFRRQLRLALGRDLADEDVARLDARADPDDAGLVEVAQGVLRDVGDVARDFLGPELGVARLDVELLDVDRREEVVLDETLGDQDRVLVVVAAPRHERDEDVAPEGQLALGGARPVGQDLPAFDPRALRGRSASG